MRLTALTWGVAFLAAVACMATVREPDSIEALLIAGEPVLIQEATVATEEADTFYVNFELIVFQEQIDEYPVVWENLQKAIAEWSSHLPVRWLILTDDPARSFSLADRHGAIQIHMTDLEEWGLPERMLGLWQPSEGRILLDADQLEQNPERAYSVSLHEMGHMLGVPHVIGFTEMGYTGFVVLPDGVDATNYVMYPRAILDKPQKELSPLEIKLARHNLVHHWTRPDVTYKECDCELYTED